MSRPESDPAHPDSEASEKPADSGVADAVRIAVERTMRATAGSAATTRGRASELVDEVVRRSRETRDQIARRGQEAGAGLMRRGQEATGEVARRLEALERRLAELESQLEPEAEVEAEDATPDRPGAAGSKPRAEG